MFLVLFFAELPLSLFDSPPWAKGASLDTPELLKVKGHVFPLGLPDTVPDIAEHSFTQDGNHIPRLRRNDTD